MHCVKLKAHLSVYFIAYDIESIGILLSSLCFIFMPLCFIEFSVIFNLQSTFILFSTLDHSLPFFGHDYSIFLM